MADENELGTAALRRTVSAARATAGGAAGATPAPPADSTATPWGNPNFLPNGTPRREPPPLPPVLELPPEPKKLSKATVPVVKPGPPPSGKQRTAWRVASMLLEQYAQEIDGNISKAELHLAQGLMKHGTLLLQHGVPMESLASLIRLARDLSHNSSTEGQEDPRIDELRKMLERDEANLPVGEVPDYSEGESDGD